MVYRYKWILSLVVIIIAVIIDSKSQRKLQGNSLTRKRILSEWKDLNNDNLTLSTPFNMSDVEESGIRLSPVGNNFLHWHFSFTGISNTPYENGCYHGQIILSPEYPRKAPSICVLTPNGRWEVGKDICLSGI